MGSTPMEGKGRTQDWEERIRLRWKPGSKPWPTSGGSSGAKISGLSYCGSTVHYTPAKLVTGCGLLGEGYDLGQGHSSACERLSQGLTAGSCFHNTLPSLKGNLHNSCPSSLQLMSDVDQSLPCCFMGLSFYLAVLFSISLIF